MRKKQVPIWEYEYLVEDSDNLTFLRDSKLIYDAILFYMVQPGLSDVDRDQMRQALEILAKMGDM